MDPTSRPGEGAEVVSAELQQAVGGALDEAETEPLAHPLSSMQGAFEESISESTEESDLPTSPVEPDAQSRRHRLLECRQYDDSWVTRWKQKPAAKYHPLQKLMAQIVFGMHLLQQQQAKSEKEVVKILQTHVNEVDTFLENTSEDFDVAIKDIEDRIRYLKLPMGHMEVFETMLDDKKFRTQLLEGNEKIEQIIERSTKAMNAALLDVEKGAQANKELGRYMRSVQHSWPVLQRAIWDVYGAMRGNEQGWRRYLRDLQAKATTLARLLAHLQKLIGDMSRMAAAASRRNKTQSSTISTPKAMPSTPGPHSRFAQYSPPTVESPPRSSRSRDSSLNKPLPKEPQTILGATQASSPLPHPVPLPDRYESPRPSPPDPATSPKTSTVSSTTRPRPKTAGEARAADARVNTSELLDFFQRPDPLRSNPNPLRSNPPDEHVEQPDNTTGVRPLARSYSQGADLMINPVNTAPTKDQGAGVTRSRSQGAIDVLTIASSAPIDMPSLQQKASVDRVTPLLSRSGREEPFRSSAENIEKRAAMRGTGFARRLSKRLKHLPLNTDLPEGPKPLTNTAVRPRTATTKSNTSFDKPTATIHKEVSPPPDSAYSSLKEKDSPPNEPLSDTSIRRESVLAPLPFQYQPPPEPESSQPFGTSNKGVAASVRSLTSSKSRAMSVKNLFRNKWRKEKMLPA